jgi:creatinine amidohydrolase/Fe(II)-dependent formamide hydrolase-like protein
MQKRIVLMVALAFATPLSAQVFHFADLNTRDFAKLNLKQTVVIFPGGILEEHGPYLPSGTDGIFNAKLADDLAHAVASRPGWSAIVMPPLPLGAGAANEVGRKYSFPGSCSVTPATLRFVFMDLADQLGQQGFRWIIVINGHGDPAHNRMLVKQATISMRRMAVRWSIYSGICGRWTSKTFALPNSRSKTAFRNTPP